MRRVAVLQLESGQQYAMLAASCDKKMGVAIKNIDKCFHRENLCV